MTIEILSRVSTFGGQLVRFRHASRTTHCDMRCSVFLPPQAKAAAVPALYWLSGLTCTDENFMAKAGAQRSAAEHGIALVAPDTSPRGDDVPDDENGAWDFGHGAGFYVSATRSPWTRHYHMYEYVTEELPALLKDNFPIDGGRRALSGHSMGGHGALIIALRNPDNYRSVSAFAPICSPMNCPWGEKALGNYLGDDKQTWREYDACALVADAAGKKFELLVEQGTADDFLETQLKPQLLTAACKKADYPLTLNMRDGYDHSYYFIATFIGEHIAFHARHLSA